MNILDKIRDSVIKSILGRFKRIRLSSDMGDTVYFEYATGELSDSAMFLEIYFYESGVELSFILSGESYDLDFADPDGFSLDKILKLIGADPSLKRGYFEKLNNELLHERGFYIRGNKLQMNKKYMRDMVLRKHAI